MQDRNYFTICKIYSLSLRCLNIYSWNVKWWAKYLPIRELYAMLTDIRYRVKRQK